MIQDDSGRAVIITGAAHGIGASVAELYAERGADLILADRDAEALDERATSIQAKHHCKVRALEIDLAKHTAATVIMEECLRQFGRIDCVVNNAALGTLQIGGQLDDLDLRTWVDAYNVNLRAAMLIMRESIPVMRDQKEGGAIVNVASSQAFRTDASRPSHAYAAFKGALISLTKAAAVSYGQFNIRANCVVPGLTKTRLTNDVRTDTKGLNRRLRGVPLGRVGEPYEIANCIVFLGSRCASFVNGTFLLVDGGASAVSPYGSAVQENAQDTL